MSGHTPGPWTLNEFTACIKGPDSAILAMICNTTGDDAGKGPKPVSEANARLIAAAPELLAALKRAVDIFDELGEDKVRDSLQAVIDKAEGSKSPTQPAATGNDPNKATVSEDSESPT